MGRFTFFAMIFLVLTVFSVSCSSSKGNPVVTPVPQPQGQDSLAQADNPDQGRVFWGLWDLTIDPETLTASVQPSRDLEAHINITPFIPAPQIHINSFNPTTHMVDATVTISNPYGVVPYDVRGILYTNNQGLLLTNDDGWTDLFDVVGGQSYNPFRAYCKAYTIRQFPAHSQNSEQFLVYLPANPGTIKLGFDASYPGNCTEPYVIKNFTHTPLYNSAGATSNLRVEVSDWQNDTNAVRINAQPITGEYYTSFAWIPGESKWGVTITNNNTAPIGTYNCLVLAMSANSGYQAMYDYVTIAITQTPCPLDSNNTCTYAQTVSLVSDTNDCVDSTDTTDWFGVYAPPKGITGGTFSVSYSGAAATLAVYGAEPGDTCPGTLLGSGPTINLGATTYSHFYMKVTSTGGRSDYSLHVNATPAISKIYCKIYVAKNSTGHWPIWEAPNPDIELNLTILQNQMTWANNLLGRYGYNLVWDGTVTFMASSYYNIGSFTESEQMHTVYGKGTNKLSLYFVDTVPTGIQTAYCTPQSPRSAHNINNVYTVYSPNVWYWQQAISHEEGHELGYFFDQYIFTEEGVPCGDEGALPSGYPTYLYSDPTACYAGNLMYYYYDGWTWDRFTLTKGQQDYLNSFHYLFPTNFPSF